MNDKMTIIHCLKQLETLVFKLIKIMRYVFLNLHRGHIIDLILWIRLESVTYRSSWFDAPPS